MWCGLLRRNMSERGSWSQGRGLQRFETEPATRRVLERIMHSFAYVLTSGTRDLRERPLAPSSLSHMLGVYVLEGWLLMARSKGRGEGVANGLPKFVDVRLSPEQRAEFASSVFDSDEITRAVFGLVAEGYRVGIGYSGEHGSFTVSLTGRDTGTVNDGLCMTSFAGDALTAVALAVYKHMVVCGGVWPSSQNGAKADFG